MLTYFQLKRIFKTWKCGNASCIFEDLQYALSWTFIKIDNGALKIDGFSNLAES